MTRSQSQPETNSTPKTSEPGRLEKLGLVLRRNEQITLFAILLICGVILAIYFTQLHWKHGRTIDIDQANYREAQFSIDVNVAEWPEFANVPGIGKNLAKAIVLHRTNHGGFTSLDELTDVPGIGPHKFKTLLPYLSPLSAQDVTQTSASSTSTLDSR